MLYFEDRNAIVETPCHNTKKSLHQHLSIIILLSITWVALLGCANQSRDTAVLQPVDIDGHFGFINKSG